MNNTMPLPNVANTSDYNNFSSLTELKAAARADKKAATAEVAKQFESIFLNMMLKGMREAKLAEGMFDGQAMEKYQDMHDKQLSVGLSQSGGIGLAAVIERQLNGIAPIQGSEKDTIADYFKNPVNAAPQQSLFNSALASQLQVNKAEKNIQQDFDGTVKTFVEKLKPHAQKAAAVIGVQPEALLAQAALETGWGKLQTKMADGSPSFNLFNIKADSRWEGNRANVSTLEFRDGIAKKERANFRAYDSYEQAFDDYARFVSESRRYKQAVENAADSEKYFEGLQKAGYATDPAYANKVLTILKQGDIAAVLGEES